MLTQRLIIAAIFLLLLTLTGCRHQAAEVKTAAAVVLEAEEASLLPAAAPFPDEAERLKLFHSLVAATRTRHVFSANTEKNLGRTFDDDLPGLEREFAQADNIERLATAVNHFQNALHDAHCRYTPPSRSQWITAGFSADVEWIDDQPRFYVSRIDDPELAQMISAGDFIDEIDGIPATQFMEAFHLESNANQRHSLARDIAAFLGRRRRQLTPIEPGDNLSLVLVQRASGQKVSATHQWRPLESGGTAQSNDIDYSFQCSEQLAPRNYGPYELTATGVNFCLYTSQTSPYDAYPIVRQFSFMYSSRHAFEQLLRLDHHLLRTHLSSLPRAKAVLIDLRDNSGGNRPTYFLDWWAPEPYMHNITELLLVDDFADRAQLEQAGVTGWGSDEIDRYLAALKARSPGQQFLRRPMFCRNEACDGDTRYVPANQVTRLPLALFVGPGCVSSCDDFAHNMQENGFATLIGEPAASGFTSYRLEHRVITPDTQVDLGVIRFALSRDFSGTTGELLEGRTLPIDVPLEHTFDNREHYDRLLVDAAINALSAK